MGSRGNLMLVLNGYKFDLSRNSGSRLYWGCSESKSTGCSARVIQDNTTKQLESVKKLEHNHPILKDRKEPGEIAKLRAQYGLPPRKPIRKTEKNPKKKKPNIVLRVAKTKVQAFDTPNV